MTNNVAMVLSADESTLRVITPQGVECYTAGDKDFNALVSIYKDARRVNTINRLNYVTTNRAMLEELERLLGIPMEKEVVSDTATPIAIAPEKEVEEGLEGLINFFKEFEFEPNFRFINSFSIALTVNRKVAKDYIVNYFRLVDSSYTKEIMCKMKSPEFDMICEQVGKVAPKSTINSRFKIYYGSAGTGKTTKAQQETAGRCVICNNSMLPADLMEDFVFINGQPSFRPSMLWECMEKGLPITLDEINLLPFEALRFLQGILDGKKEFTYKGNLIHIADGFQVIGTMNLIVNGAVFNLPEPLVDRASEMKEFKLTAKQLLKAIL